MTQQQAFQDATNSGMMTLAFWTIVLIIGLKIKYKLQDWRKRRREARNAAAGEPAPPK